MEWNACINCSEKSTMEKERHRLKYGTFLISKCNRATCNFSAAMTRRDASRFIIPQSLRQMPRLRFFGPKRSLITRTNGAACVRHLANRLSFEIAVLWTLRDEAGQRKISSEALMTVILKEKCEA